jgi:hypothetical protein
MTTAANSIEVTNGRGAAAVLAAGIGSFALGFLSLLGDKNAAVKAWMVFSKPVGALSGVTTCTLIVWIAAWAILQLRWRDREIRFGPVGIVSLLLLALGMLLTFPPFADLL